MIPNKARSNPYGIDEGARSKARFKLYSFDEIAEMSTEEWTACCRRDGNVDMAEHPEEAAIRELGELQAMKAINT
jgi:hypothetical protein